MESSLAVVMSNGISVLVLWGLINGLPVGSRVIRGKVIRGRLSRRDWVAISRLVSRAGC